jgi:hypothetical protein
MIGTTLNKILSVFIILSVLVGLIFAQSSTQKNRSLVTKGLALQIIFAPDRPPTFIEYIQKKAEFGHAWYAGFKRLPNFRLPSDALPVRAVNIVPRLEKNAVTVAVSVFRGKTTHEKEEPVITFTLKEDEKVVVRELISFGVEPFELSLVWFNPERSSLSTVVNYTSSLSVTRVESTVSTLPTFIVHFLNKSDKPILAFTFEIRVEDRIRLSGMPQGDLGLSLIEAGGSYRNPIKNALQIVKAEKGDRPPIEPLQTLFVKSVIFADGSYEGDTNDAMTFLSFTVGRRIILKELIKLIKQFETTQSLISEIDNLKISLDEQNLVEYSNKFKLPISRSSVNIAINGEKLKFRQAFESIKNQKTEEIRLWLSKKEIEYLNFLSRLP